MALMDGGNGRGMSLGGPGERQQGKIDLESQVILVGAQGGARWLTDVLAFLAALVLGFALGGLGAWAFGSAILWMNAANIETWLLRRSKNPWLNTLFTWAFSQAGLLILSAAWLVALKVFLPFEWAYDFTAPRSIHRHWLVIFRTTAEGFADNQLVRFPLVLRLIVGALPVTYYLTSPLLRRRFSDELRAPFPARAVDYTQAGLDTRTWGDGAANAQPGPTITIEKVEDTPRGRRVVGYDALQYPEEIRRAFIALNAGRIARISWRAIAELDGIGQTKAKAIVKELRDNGYIDYPNGDQNGAELTGYGRALARKIVLQ